MTTLGHERQKRTTPLKRLWENHTVYLRGPCLDSNLQACHTWRVRQTPGVHKTPLAKGTRGCHKETEAFVGGLCYKSQETYFTDSLPRNECKYLYIYLTIMKKYLSMIVHKDIRHMCGDMRTHMKLSMWKQEAWGLRKWLATAESLCLLPCDRRGGCTMP